MNKRDEERRRKSGLSKIGIMLILVAAMVLCLPAFASAESGISQISGGQYHSLLVQENGTLWGWGLNDIGQLGINQADYGYHLVKEPYGVADQVKAISAGKMHTAVIRNDGTLWTCGQNWFGELGIGKVDSELHDKLVKVEGMDHVKSVSAGHEFTAIVKEDGSLWMCGRNYCGQFGNGTTEDSSVPIKVMDSGVAAVSAGGGYTTAIIMEDGTLWMCGDNEYGQLGTGGSKDMVTKPVEIVFKDDSGNKLRVKSANSGWSHTAVVTEDGTLWTFGENKSGQLGDGTDIERRTPVKVATGVKEAYADGINYAQITDFTAVLKEDGTLWMCGNNTCGQLGNGAQGFDQRFNPDLAQTMTDVASIATGYEHTIAVKTDGTLWAWGNTTYGQVGNGVLEGNVCTPTQIYLKKAANPMTVKGKTAMVNYAKLQKKNQTLKRSKVLTMKKAKGKVTYTKKSGNKKITINRTTGKVTVKKGLKKGKTYKVKVAVKAAGNVSYKSKTVTTTFKIKIK